MNKKKERLYACVTRCLFTWMMAACACIFTLVQELSLQATSLTSVQSIPFIPYYYTLPRSLEYIAAGVLLYVLFSLVLTMACRES